MYDELGVPHIFAKTDAEVAYGLAWAEAETISVDADGVIDLPALDNRLREFPPAVVALMSLRSASHSSTRQPFPLMRR